MEDQDSDITKLAKAWGGRVPDDEIADFLALNAEKRVIAIDRITSLQKLCSGPERSTAAQRAEAEKLGIGMKRLQGLMRAWVHPSIAAVTPHGRKVTRKRRLNPGRDVAQRVVAKELRRYPMIAEPTVHRRIARICERLGMKCPARMTVRHLLDQQRRAMLPDIARIESLPARSPPPAYCGEVLLLTIETFRGRVVDGGRAPRPATALVLVDIASEIVLAMEPNNDLARLARSAADIVIDPPPGLSWHRPRKLLLAAPLPDDEEWRDRLREAAETIGIDIELELQRRVRRWLAGLWRGPHGLPSVSPTSSEKLPADWPALSREELGRTLDHMMASHNLATERILDGREMPLPTVYQSAEAAQDILTLFASVNCKQNH